MPDAAEYVRPGLWNLKPAGSGQLTPPRFSQTEVQTFSHLGSRLQSLARYCRSISALGSRIRRADDRGVGGGERRASLGVEGGYQTIRRAGVTIAGLREAGRRRMPAALCVEYPLLYLSFGVLTGTAKASDRRTARMTR